MSEHLQQPLPTTPPPFHSQLKHEHYEQVATDTANLSIDDTNKVEQQHRNSTSTTTSPRSTASTSSISSSSSSSLSSSLHLNPHKQILALDDDSDEDELMSHDRHSFSSSSSSASSSATTMHTSSYHRHAIPPASLSSSTSVPSLLDLCISYVCDHLDEVPDLAVYPEYIVQQLLYITLMRSALTPASAKLFRASGHESIVNWIDSNLDLTAHYVASTRSCRERF